MNSQVERLFDEQHRMKPESVGQRLLLEAFVAYAGSEVSGLFFGGQYYGLGNSEIIASLASQPPVLDEREGWRPMDSAPKDRNLLLACDDFAQSIYLGKPVPMKVGGWHEDDGNWRVFGASWRPTHWRDLPEPPQVRAEIRNLGGPDDVA